MKEQQIAQSLYDSWKNGTPISPLRDAIDNNVDSAYEIQRIWMERRVADGARVVGKKIGLTSFAVQAQLGVDEPDYGVLLDSMDKSGTPGMSVTELMQPKAEGELAFVLHKDLTNENITMESLIEAIAEVRPALEIVGSRVKDWNIRIADTVADNASASHFVLGADALPLAQVNTKEVGMKLYKNNALDSQGSGAACMDDPLIAALWLARKMKAYGNPLRAGEVILSGALGPMLPVAAGDKFRLEIDGFAPLHFSFS